MDEIAIGVAENSSRDAGSVLVVADRYFAGNVH